jgi:peptidyl-dipeptidase A
MFEISEEFFVSLGLDKLPDEFWKRSVFKRPNDTSREMNCHASAWDFYDGKDFR